MADTIRITKTCAVWLISFAKQLVNDGYGVNYDPFNPIQGLEPLSPGFIEQIPMEDGELWRFVNAMLNFARTVAGILANSLNNEDALELTLSDFTIEDEI